MTLAEAACSNFGYSIPSQQLP